MLCFGNKASMKNCLVYICTNITQWVELRLKAIHYLANPHSILYSGLGFRVKLAAK